MKDRLLAACDNLSTMAQMALRRWEALDMVRTTLLLSHPRAAKTSKSQTWQGVVDAAMLQALPQPHLSDEATCIDVQTLSFLLRRRSAVFRACVNNSNQGSQET